MAAAALPRPPLPFWTVEGFLSAFEVAHLLAENERQLRAVLGERYDAVVAPPALPLAPPASHPPGMNPPSPAGGDPTGQP